MDAAEPPPAAGATVRRRIYRRGLVSRSRAVAIMSAAAVGTAALIATGSRPATAAPLADRPVRHVSATMVTNTFGTRYVNGLRYGVGVLVTTPDRNSQYLAPVNFTLNRAVIQSEFGTPSTAALAQAGLYRSGDRTWIDTCTGHSDLISHLFFEWKPAGNTGYTCQMFSPGVTIGTTHACNVWVAADGWHMDIDYGAEDVIRRLSVSTAYLEVGGEMASIDGTFNSASIVTYGGGGAAAFPWTVYRGNDMGSPITVGSGTTTYLNTPSTGWVVPQPPTPFSIGHPG
ncbi:MAG: hypothetical protein ACR2F6_05830 [Mycobacteriales bacterium]